MKELIAKINHEENTDKKLGMLEALNMIYGTKFGLLGGRVVAFEDPEAALHNKYSDCYDVWSNL